MKLEKTTWFLDTKVTRIDDAWTEEIRERIRKFDSGETKGIPGAEVFAEVDRRLAP